MFINRSIISTAVVGMGALFALSCGTGDVILNVNGVPDTLQIVSVDVANGTTTLSELSLIVGDTAALTATAFNALSEPLGNTEIFWTSSSAAVASVSTEGVVVAVATGQAAISATAGSFVATVPTVVSADPLEIVSIRVRNGTTTLGQLRLEEGATASLTATALNASGDPVTATIAWASSAPGVASVTSQGVVSALVAGTATISATAGGVVRNIATTVSEEGDPPVGIGGLYDPYLPAAWTDTVHYEDFTGAAATSRFDAVSAAAGPAPFNNLQSWGGYCVGGAGPSGYGGPGCRAQDSVVFANQATPPWVWESRLAPNSAGNLTYEASFANGNGPGAAANLTRLYLRYSIFFEEAGVGVGQTNYVWQPGSNKYFNFNTISNGFFLLWYDEAPIFVGQSSPNTEGCSYGLTANTWVDYYPADTLAPQGAFGNEDCISMGRGGHGKTGVWQHHFVCIDFSPGAGSRIMSWGMYSEDEQGIAGYHDNMTNYNQVGVGTATDFDSWIWNGTWGGSPKTHPEIGYWFDDLLIMTGTSGSCVTPPSF